MVDDRDGRRCVRCGRSLYAVGGSRMIGRAHGGGFADRTDEESNRLFTSGWATRGEAVRMLKCLDCEEKTT